MFITNVGLFSGAGLLTSASFVSMHLGGVSCRFPSFSPLAGLPRQVMHGIGLKAIDSEHGGGGPEVDGAGFPDKIGRAGQDLQYSSSFLMQQGEANEGLKSR